MSEKFVRKNKFRKMKLERLIYVKNIDGILNYIGLIVDIVKVELFLRDIRKEYQ